MKLSMHASRPSQKWAAHGELTAIRHKSVDLASAVLNDAVVYTRPDGEQCRLRVLASVDVGKIIGRSAPC
jgi:hypothetical protein